MRIRGIGPLAIVALLTLGASASAQVVGRVDLATVRVTAVPGPPSGDFWDGSIIGGLPGLVGAIIKKTSAPYYPDIEICVGSRAACRLVCVNAQLNADDPKLRPACGLQLDRGFKVADLVEANGRRDWRIRDLAFEVNEIGEDGSTANRRNIGRLALYAGADPPILQPDKCSESEPCTRTVQMEGGPLSLSFTTVLIEAATQPPPSLPGAPTGPGAPSTGKTGEAQATDEGLPARIWSAAVDHLDSWFPEKGWTPFVRAGTKNVATGKVTLECCIDSNDVRQGWYDDCYLLSALAAVAAVSPGTIKDAIQYRSKTEYAIRVFKGNELKSRVVSSTPYEPWVITQVGYSLISLKWGRNLVPFPHSQPADGGLEVWPMLFERAYAHIVLAKKEVDDEDVGPLFTGGGDSSGALRAITGRPNKNLLLAPMPPSGLGGTTAAEKQTFHGTWETFLSTEGQLRTELERLRQLTTTPGKRVAMTAGTIGPCSTFSWWNVFSWFQSTTQMVGGVPTDEFRCYGEGQGRLFADGTLIPNHAYYIKRFNGKEILFGNPFGDATDVSLPLSAVLDSFRAIYYVEFERTQQAGDCDCTLTP